MRFVYSDHWTKKKRRRKEITDDVLEYAMTHSPIIRDRRHAGVWNAIARIPPSGRKVKVAYRRTAQGWKIITAYWMD